VAIVGFGYVGSCLGVTLADRGFDVRGIDTDPSLLGELAAGNFRFSEPGMAELWTRLSGSGRLRVTPDYSAAADADVVLITVGEPVENSQVSLRDRLVQVSEQLAGILRSSPACQLVLLKSTVPPGTTRQVVLPLLESSGRAEGTDFGLAYCPERLAEGSALRQLRTLPIVVGGCSEASTAAAAAFWDRALGVQTLSVGSPDVAEMIKLASNYWIDANVAIANELARACAALGVNVLEVIRGANTLPKGSSQVNILLPSLGVGGACLPRDPWRLWQAARDAGVRMRTVETARAVNDAMPGYTSDLIREGLARLGRPLAGATVGVLGLSFKSNTGDLRMTPVKPVVEGLLEAGASVRIFDPLAAADEVKSVFGLPAAESLDEAVEDADCIAVLAGHQEFLDVDYRALAGLVRMPCLVLDGRAYYPPGTVALLGELGFSYRGIGW
jgi:UDP-N-acetyl-D-mannosaminuronic acid dehydrogenase